MITTAVATRCLCLTMTLPTLSWQKTSSPSSCPTCALSKLGALLLCSRLLQLCNSYDDSCWPSAVLKFLVIYRVHGNRKCCTVSFPPMHVGHTRSSSRSLCNQLLSSKHSALHLSHSRSPNPHLPAKDGCSCAPPMLRATRMGLCFLSPSICLLRHSIVCH